MYIFCSKFLFPVINSKMTITLYYLPASPPCRAVLLTARALGIELDLRLTNLRKGEHLTPEYLKLNPQHTIPTMDDDGFVINESRAIICYLADQYGKDDSLYPKDPKKRALIHQQLYFDMGTLHIRHAELNRPILFAGAPYDEEKAKKLDEALGYLDGYLSKSTYAAGDTLTLADLSLVATVSTLELIGFNISKHANVTRWLQICKETIPDYEKYNHEGALEYKAMYDAAKKKK